MHLQQEVRMRVVQRGCYVSSIQSRLLLLFQREVSTISSPSSRKQNVLHLPTLLYLLYNYQHFCGLVFLHGTCYRTCNTYASITLASIIYSYVCVKCHAIARYIVSKCEGLVLTREGACELYCNWDWKVWLVYPVWPCPLELLNKVFSAKSMSQTKYTVDTMSILFSYINTQTET